MDFDAQLRRRINRIKFMAMKQSGYNFVFYIIRSRIIELNKIHNADVIWE